MKNATFLNIKFSYEKKKECVLANEEMFNILVNKIKIGIDNLEYEKEDEIEEKYYETERMKTSESDIEIKKLTTETDIEIKKLDNETAIELKKLDNEKEIELKEKEIELKKIEMITELIKNKIITIDEFKNMLSLLK